MNIKCEIELDTETGNYGFKVNNLAEPGEAVDYLRYLEEKLGVPIAVVSTGPRREETMIRGTSDLTDRLRGIIRSS